MRSDFGTLTRGEWWLLETAVDCEYPIWFVAKPEPNLSLALNHKGHGLNRSELCAAFRTLRDRGDILFCQVPSGQPIALTDEELFANLQPVDNASQADAPYYALTPAGGARWEAAAEADWSRFFKREYPGDSGDWSEGPRVLTAGSPVRLRELLDHLAEFLFTEVVPGSVIEDVVRPWQATHWKTLPVGYRAHYRAKRSEPSWAPQPPDRKATYRAFAAWYRYSWHGGWGGTEPAPGAGPIIRT